jgi:GNAT superfamily N-acetyltransferase
VADCPHDRVAYTQGKTEFIVRVTEQAKRFYGRAMKMEHRFATDRDLDLLAEWNHQLIRDEGHRNPMTVPELRERMRGWLGGEYRAVIFGPEAEPVAYALYRENATEVYLRQLFVRRDRRSQGIGRSAMGILRSQIWPSGKRLTVEVLVANVRAVAFWRSLGYQDYCLTLEITPAGESACAPP